MDEPTRALSERGWRLVLDARVSGPLQSSAVRTAATPGMARAASASCSAAYAAPSASVRRRAVAAHPLPTTTQHPAAPVHRGRPHPPAAAPDLAALHDGPAHRNALGELDPPARDAADEVVPHRIVEDRPEHPVLPAHGARSPLCSPAVDERLDVTGLTGITEYQPDECTFTALAGTPVTEIERRLAEMRR